MSDVPSEVDRRKVRLGLAIILAVFVVALIAAVLVDDPAGRAFMIAVVVIAVVRAFLLARSLRRERG